MKGVKIASAVSGNDRKILDSCLRRNDKWRGNDIFFDRIIR